MNLRYDGILILNVIKSVNFDVIRKLIRYSLKNLRVKLMLAVTVFKMLLFDCRLVLPSGIPVAKGLIHFIF